MESSRELRQSLRDAERGEASPWIDYPVTPAWYPVFMGSWAAAFTAVLAFVDGFVFFLVLVGLIVVGTAFNAWYRRLRGTMPTGLPPTELRRPAITFTVGLLVTAAAGGILASDGLPWVAVLVVFVGIASVTWWYERAYAAAAGRTRERLA